MERQRNQTFDPRTTASPTVSPHSPLVGTNGCLSLALFLHKVSPSGFLVVVAGGREPLKSGENVKETDLKSKNYDGVFHLRRWTGLLPAAVLRPSVLSRLLNSSVLRRPFLSWNPFSTPVNHLALITTLVVCVFIVDRRPSRHPDFSLDPIHLGILIHTSTAFITTTTGVHFAWLAATERSQ
ncbi:hypothetical protein B0T20DRAFT_634 [Sordaria brevicollis]|uniref:Uncharacterized protein n=1 Tax=Sordaria brevicollis TaxID=83679 RepID=A0AAE0PLZ8_SORBR|nr:hypothetical protein B0T20DRAFT_634 [Sordaria brevicollis]